MSPVGGFRPPTRAAVPAFVLAFVLLGPGAARAQWSVEGFLGNGFSAKSPLTIRQKGESDIRITASWETRPLEQAPYYAVRVTRRLGRLDLFADLLHHKVYLRTTPGEVEKFEITYGYNLLGAGIARRAGGWRLFAAGGPVITNPTSIVRGKEHPHGGRFLGTGYALDGAHVQAGVNRRHHLSGRFFLSADLRLTAAWARVPVAGGSADVPNYAAHLLLGVGFGAP